MATGGPERARTDAEVAEAIRGLVDDRPQRELAELLGIDQSAISRALSGKRAFNLREVALIADWAGTDTDDILFAQPNGFAFRCDSGDSQCDAAARKCRDIVRDLFAFRAVAG